MPLKRHNARRKNSPCGNTHCEPGWKCVNGGCQKNKGAFKGNKGLNVKRAAGGAKRTAMQGFTRFLGKLVPSNPDKKVKKKLKRTKEFRDNPGGEAGYKLKF
tara:strand:- start:153 stop:458 length:306 start_codon:yes stop_codon:yes gene_type:complete